jgi:hypothetical protein
MRPSYSFHSPFHTNISDLTKVMLPILLAIKFQSGTTRNGKDGSDKW